MAIIRTIILAGERSDYSFTISVMCTWVLILTSLCFTLKIITYLPMITNGHLFARALMSEYFLVTVIANVEAMETYRVFRITFKAKIASLLLMMRETV